MTILPTGPATSTSPLTPDTGTGPGDFMAAIEQALAAALGMPALVPGAPSAPAAPGFEAPASAVAPQPAVMGAVGAKPAPVVEPVETTAPGFEAPAGAVAPQPPVVGSAVTKPAPVVGTAVAKPAPVVEPVETPVAGAPKATPAPGFEAPAGAVAPQPPVVRSAATKPATVVEPVETRAAKPGFEAPASAVAPQPPAVRSAVTKPAPVVEPLDSPAAPAAQPITAKPTAHDQPDSGPSDQPSQQAPAPTPTPTPSTLPLTSAVPLPAASTTTTQASPAHVPATAVREQVFGEVTSLVSRGPGTHRITLTLHPEDLGEVRVVMTVRDGGVHVRLAAGAEAHQALLEGSSELGRLLERAGATESRVVVREFTPAAPATSADSSQLNLGTGDRPTDQHAGTRADHPATDGADRLLTRRPPVLQEARPRQPVSEARTSGLDLTM